MRTHSRMRSPLLAATAIVAAGALVATLVLPVLDAEARSSKAWRQLAGKLRSSSKAEAKADYLLALARAGLIVDKGDRGEAIATAKEEFKEEKGLTKDAYKARLELADDLEEDAVYSVELDPTDFVAGISHPFLPYAVGNEWTYVGETEDGTETIVVTVLSETKEILGVTCTVVRDTVSIGGELVEDTRDWYAQDNLGNVWYMGEIALNYEDGQITDVDGSWEAGVDGAQPGIVMPAVLTVGDVYRTEFYAGEAEDYIEILALDASATVPFGGTYTNCLQNFDGTPMEPDVEEHKFYADGIGLVLEEKPLTEDQDEERIELVSFTTD